MCPRSGSAGWQFPDSGGGRWWRMMPWVRELFVSQNRYRDVVIAPDNRTIYFVTDVQGRTTDAGGAITTRLVEPGAILEFKYTGSR